MSTKLCHCGKPATPNDYPSVCDQWPLCERTETVESIEAEWSPLAEACDACGAEPGEPCRPGCLGYAIEHDELAGTEPCS